MTPKPDAAEPSKSSSALPADWRYEATIRCVESIINEIEGGELDLAEVFERFSMAITYLGECETFLGDRQAEMELLIEDLGEIAEF